MVTLTTEAVEIANKPRTLIAHTCEATDTLIIIHARHSNGDSKLLVFSPDTIPFLKLVLIYPSVPESTGFITQKKNKLTCQKFTTVSGSCCQNNYML